MDDISDDFLWELKPHIPWIVGQIAAPLSGQETFRSYDLVTSSLPNFVDYFRSQGLRAELQRLAFESSVLERITRLDRSTNVSFVGSLSSHHESRVRLLEIISSNKGLSLWGQNMWIPSQRLPESTNATEAAHGESKCTRFWPRPGSL